MFERWKALKNPNIERVKNSATKVTILPICMVGSRLHVIFVNIFCTHLPPRRDPPEENSKRPPRHSQNGQVVTISQVRVHSGALYCGAAGCCNLRKNYYALLKRLTNSGASTVWDQDFSHWAFKLTTIELSG